MHIILLLIAITILTLTFFPKKKLRHRNRQGLIPILNNKLSRLHYKKDSEKYIRLRQKIINSGIDIEPETYQTLRIMLPLAAIVSYVLFKSINYINLYINIDELMEAAEVLNDNSVLNINIDIKLREIILLSLIAFITPALIIKLMASIKSKLSKKESLMLQTYTIMLLKTSQPVKQILVSIYERANYFKSVLEISVSRFSSDPNKALEELKNSSQGDFRNICIALQMAMNSDRQLSIQYLENRRNLSREVNKQIRIRNQTRNQGIGILVMMIPLMVSLAIVGYPWIMYTIKAIRTIPI